MKKLLAVALVATVACGCVCVNKSDGGTACLRPTILKDAVHEKYTISETPVTAKATAVTILGFITIGDPEVTHWSDNVDGNVYFFGAAGIAKNAAYSKACEENNCDSIVSARYTITRTNFFFYDQAVAELTGYPAKFAGIEVLPPPVPGCPAQK